MFCIHCGARGAKSFCASCGTSQVSESADARASADEVLSSHEDAEIIVADIRWTDTLQYAVVLNQPEARARIAACANEAKQGVSGEDLLALFDAVSTIGFSLGKLTKAILPIYDKLGIKTSREAQVRCVSPPGRVLLAALCAFASRGLKIEDVEQATNACCLTAKIAAGIVTNSGQLQVMLSVHESDVLVKVSATTSGQWYDWGKAQGLADAVCTTILQEVDDQQTGQPPRLGKVA